MKIGCSFIALLLISTSPVLAMAGDLPSNLSSATVTIAKNPSGDRSPHAIAFENSKVSVHAVQSTGKTALVADLEGRFTFAKDTENWSLIAGSKVLRMDRQGVFRVSLPLTGRVTMVSILAVGLRGEVARDQAGVVFEGYNEALAILNAPPVEEKAQVTVGLGVSALDYNDATISGVGQTRLLAKVSVDQPLGRGGPWTLGLNAFTTFIPVSQKTTHTTEFFGANARIGYRVWSSGRWTLRTYGGIYYTTTYGGSGDLGYRNLAGPQVYPALAYQLGSGAVALMYLKFSLLASGFKFYSSDNREVATGVQYFFAPFSKGWLERKSLGLTADFSWLSLKTAALGTSSFNTMGLGIALKF